MSPIDDLMKSFDLSLTFSQHVPNTRVRPKRQPGRAAGRHQSGSLDAGLPAEYTVAAFRDNYWFINLAGSNTLTGISGL
jgi:hypothetical protein